MKIPYQELADATLTAIIEEFITREGTDYGDYEYSLEQKVTQVKRQLHRGEVCVSYDPQTQSCQLLAAEECRADPVSEYESQELPEVQEMPDP